jgi:hypothetical protein
MSVAAVVLSLSAAAAVDPGTAASASIGSPDTPVSASLAFLAAVPQGSFADRQRQWPLGLSLSLLARLRPLPLEVGPVLGVLGYGGTRYRRSASLAWNDGSSTREAVTVSRSQDMLSLGVLGRLIPRRGLVRPFLEGSLAMALWKADEDLDVVGNDRSTTDNAALDDCLDCWVSLTWAAEAGGGLAVALNGWGAGSPPPVAVELSLGGKWRWGGPARYDLPGTERASARSTTDMMVFWTAIAIGRR